jgi:CBS domain-containing protein
MNDSPIDSIKAATLLRDNPLVIDGNSTVHEALAVMANQEATLALLVVDEHNQPLGCLDAETIVMHLLADQTETLESGELPASLDERLMDEVKQLPLGRLVTINPEDNLAIMLLRAREGSPEWLLVVDGTQVLGTVSLADLYVQAATLALAGDDRNLPFLQSSTSPSGKGKKTAKPRTKRSTAKS